MKKSMTVTLATFALAGLIGAAGVTTFAVTGSTDKTAQSTADDESRDRKRVSNTHVNTTSIAALVLDKTEDEMKTALEDNTLGKLLTAAGKLDTFKKEYLAAYQSKLDEAVTAETLTQSEADEKYKTKKAAIDAWDGTTDLVTRPGKGGSRSAGETKSSKGSKGVHVDVIAVAAAILDKTEDEVKDAVKDSKVGDLLIAADKVDAFKTAYLKESKTKLDEAVTAGTLTQAEADEKYAAEKTKLDDYDGTTHLCGGKDHSKMFEKNSEQSASET